ncbi:MAG: hypothetical protein AAFV53_36275 [Myxococcota bacterium]
MLPIGCKEEQPTIRELDVDQFATGCYTVRSGDQWLAPTRAGDGYALSADASLAARFRMQPADLGTYLFYDAERHYLVSDDGPLLRQQTLESDITRIEDRYISGAEWILETSSTTPNRYQLKNHRNDRWLKADGLTGRAADALQVRFEPAEGCAVYPELSIDATGAVEMTRFEDGDLYGIADIHSHIFTDQSFGGGLYHGGAFHRLGVEHALGDCAAFHGEMGRKDFFGYVFDSTGTGPDDDDLIALVTDLLEGELSEDNHRTDGYPTFSDWPARRLSTHQTQYYRWIERAWMAGLRLVVQHATSNAVICNLSAGEGLQPSFYDCEDMTATDRIFEATFGMERYIDALHGGPGKGWFRIVTTPAQAREVIADGKMAVVLGIETSDLFDCHITPRPGAPTCDETYVLQQLDAYYELGVRVLFPVHKYDNRFSAGDGQKGFIELGNFFNSGHWTNMTQACPAPPGMPTGFDDGPVTFGGILEEREDYLAPPPNDFSEFSEEPIITMLGQVGAILEPGLEGEWCQASGLTDLGEMLMEEMMARGMLIELDHFPQRSYIRAYEMLEDNDYPAIGSHGREWGGRLYALGGVKNIFLGRCRDPNQPGAMTRVVRAEAEKITAEGGFPAPPLGFDFNGFATSPRPRFGERGCGDGQEDPVTYPFDSFAGDVTFTQPFVGERMIDFNTEGMVHIGLLPEYLQDARADAASDADLEPIFRSAEAYIRMWEKAEDRAAGRR